MALTANMTLTTNMGLSRPRLQDVLQWPKTVNLIGFEHAEVKIDAERKVGDEIVTRLRSALMQGLVTSYVPIEGWDAESAAFQFDYLGFRYEVSGNWYGDFLHEFQVDTIEKIALLDEPDEFSEQYGDHFPIVVRDFRKERLHAESDTAGTW